jgi:peptidoglycan hydrolase-like protein with peptidoglycan-binding domain
MVTVPIDTVQLWVRFGDNRDSRKAVPMPVTNRPRVQSPVTSTVAAPSVSTELAKGSTGPAVEKMQQQLEVAGFKTKTGVDGKFGKETKAALEGFQSSQGLPATGRLDPATNAKLQVASAPKPPVADRFEPGAPVPPGASEVGALAQGAKGPAVKAAQEQLIKAGYELPKFGADGDFGGETVGVLKRFQSDNKLTPSGTLDTPTLAALKNAKPASQVQYPEYDKMMADGVLNTTIAVGYDEDGNDVSQRQELVQGLVERGFAPLDVTNMNDAALKAKGLDPATIDKGASYYLKSMEHNGKPVQALVKIVDRNAPNPKGQFADSMKKDDLVIYSGHARYGSGPDFDDIHSKDGNFVIGEAYEAGHVTYGENDLKKTKLSDNYQLMFFDGCSTKHYVDDLRSVPKNKSAENLDIVASNRPISWSTSTPDVFAMLDGVMQKKSIQDIKTTLDTLNTEEGKPPAFMVDGFKGNHYRAPA